MAQELAPGQVLGAQGQYTILGVLGSGSNAITYKAVTAAGLEVAIKALTLRGLKDWKQLDLFQREAQVLASLSHPSIPTYIDYFEQDLGSDMAFYIVQEVARGKSLAEMVSGGKRASESEVMRIAVELLQVLQYLAGLRPAVTHRDVKPENIILEGGSWSGRVYLVDFGGVQGIAAAGGSSGMGSTIVGTFGYMAPEQFRGAAQPASDLYALGATLLYVLSGRNPFEFPQERMQLSWRPSFPPPTPLWGTLLDGLLEPVAEDRLTAQEALDVLQGKARVTTQATRSRARRESELDPPARSAREARGVLARQDALGRSGVAFQLSRPAGSRVVLERTAGRLDINIPPKGMGADTLFTASFALAWNAFVAFWTFGALASGGILFALFSAPFWLAGVQLGRTALGGVLIQERLAIGRP
ncbi:MAG: hypothetical protein WDW38_004178 [Sanguina aurantia]